MPFDLMEYARQRRYRTRNLHDGEPVPPTKRPKYSGMPAFIGDDRLDAIIGRYGYVSQVGERDGRLGFVLLLKKRAAMMERLRKLQGLDAEVTQEGDTEAAGNFPDCCVDEVMPLIGVYKLQFAGTPPIRSDSGPEGETKGTQNQTQEGETSQDTQRNNPGPQDGPGCGATAPGQEIDRERARTVQPTFRDDSVR